MNIENYFKNLTLELESLKDRVRLYIEDAHWQSDGEWKESVLRTILRRHLPKNIGIGRGFIVNVDQASTQIDILLYDNSKPILFQDGDFIIITPDAAKGVIEVKTKFWQQDDLRDAINKISEISQFINPTSYGKDQFFGLFAYEDSSFSTDSVLGILQECVNGQKQRIVNCISFGKNYFVRYWPSPPLGQLPKWNSYQLENKASAYFVHNVIDHLCPKWVSDNINVWYPENGKENYIIDEINLPLPHQITD
jgi:hypothetical protein